MGPLPDVEDMEWNPARDGAIPGSPAPGSSNPISSRCEIGSAPIGGSTAGVFWQGLFLTFKNRLGTAFVILLSNPMLVLAHPIFPRRVAERTDEPHEHRDTLRNEGSKQSSPSDARWRLCLPCPCCSSCRALRVHSPDGRAKRLHGEEKKKPRAVGLGFLFKSNGAGERT